MKEKILAYLMSHYAPHTIILYGSYADGSHNKNSDFDALIITDKQCIGHDDNSVEGVLLDVFIYHSSEFTKAIDFKQFIQIYNGNIVRDTKGYGKKLSEGVVTYINQLPKKTMAEKQQAIAWCEKMLTRIQRSDAEGYYRWHWLLIDSLEIYYNLRDEYYQGPKKGLLKMKATNPKAYKLYEAALKALDCEALGEWIQYLSEAFNKQPKYL